MSSEHPFGARDAWTSVREYDQRTGRLVRVFSPDDQARFRRPGGLSIGPDGDLYCVCRDGVVVFSLDRGRCQGELVQLPRLNGQALAFLARGTPGEGRPAGGYPAGHHEAELEAQGSTLVREPRLR